MKNYFHSLTLGLDYKDFKESTVLQGADTSIDAPINYLNWSIQYEGTLLNKRGRTKFSIGTRFGIRGLANDSQEFENTLVEVTSLASFLLQVRRLL